MTEVTSKAQFGLLGPLYIEQDGIEIKVSAGQQRVVLAALLLGANRVVTVDRMADLIWGDALPRAADVTVRGYVKRLRVALGPVLKDRVVTRASGYSISVRDDEVDLARFERSFRRGGEAVRTEGWRQAFDALSQATDLWRGAPLEDIPSDMLRAEVAESLTEKRIQALEWRAEAGLQLGLHADLVADLVLLCEQHPAREPLRAQYIRALYMCGRQADALNAFQQARNWLVDELGVEPGPELRRLHERILAHDPDLTRPQPPAILVPAPPAPAMHASTRVESSATGHAPAQLPADIAEFTGREEQVAGLCEFLSDVPVADNPGGVPIALVAGAGGLGKTALAVHTAHRLAHRFPDGQLYVDLLGGSRHPLSPGQVLARFLHALGIDDATVPDEPAEREALYRTRVAGSRMLILLDNARDSAQVKPLLPGSASSVVLITTRTRLADLPSVKLLDLNVLADQEALSLFTRTVGAERVKAEPDGTADLLRSCGGFPLAIRICAARLVTRPRWTIEDMSGRVRDSRRTLDELRTGDLAVRASFQMSFDSLPTGAGPARAFGFLGLWQGAFIGIEAATALLGCASDEAEEALETLIDCCLLESPAPGYYRFHDLLRVYAAEIAHTRVSVSDRDAALSRLVDWYLHSVDAATSAIAPLRTRPPIPEIPPGLRPLRFADAETAMDWLEFERGNIVAATRQASSASLDEAAWMLPATAAAFYNRRGYRSDCITTHELALVSARKIADLRGVGYVLNNLGMAYNDFDMDAAIGFFAEALRTRRQVGDARGEAQTSSNLLNTYLYWGRFREVVAMYPETMDCQRRAEWHGNEGVVLINVAEAHLALGEIIESIECLRRAEEVFREYNDVRGLGNACLIRGDAHFARGDEQEAIGSYRRSVELLRSIRDGPGEAQALLRWGRAASSIGLRQEARSLLSQALAQFRALGDVRWVTQTQDELSKVSLE